MLSDRTGSHQQTHRERPRVIKSHQAAGVRVAFPALEQVASSDLPPSLSAAFRSASVPPPQPAPATLLPEEAERLIREAREAESRARALERRAEAILAEAEETAGARLAETEQRVQRVLTEVESAAEAVKAEAREQGWTAGHNEGYAAGRAEAEELITRAHSQVDAILAEARREAEGVRDEALEQRALLLDASREQLLDLAFVMARHVLKTELALHPEAMLPMLEAALAKMKGEEEPQIRVSKAVASLLEEQRGRLLAALPGARGVRIESDASMEPGDFVAQGGQGVLDGRLERQMALLEEQVRQEEK